MPLYFHNRRLAMNQAQHTHAKAPAAAVGIGLAKGWSPMHGNGHGAQLLAHDSHDDALVANVHPTDWTNPEPAPRYNLVVIGAGTAGLVTAAGAAGLG